MKSGWHSVATVPQLPHQDRRVEAFGVSTPQHSHISGIGLKHDCSLVKTNGTFSQIPLCLSARCYTNRYYLFLFQRRCELRFVLHVSQFSQPHDILTNLDSDHPWFSSFSECDFVWGFYHGTDIIIIPLFNVKREFSFDVVGVMGTTWEQ